MGSRRGMVPVDLGDRVGSRELAMTKRSLTVLLVMFLVLLAPRSPAQEKPAQQPSNVVGQLGSKEPAQDGDSASNRPLQRRDWRYQLQPGDVLELTFPLTSEFNQAVTIQPDGYVTLRGLGDVRIEGQTLPQFKELLQTAYSK